MKKFSLLRTAFFLLLATALVAGCSAAPSAPTADLLGTIVAQTLTAVPPTLTPTTETDFAATPALATSALPAAIATFTPESTTIHYVYTQVDNLNLRVQPGTLFKVSRVMPKGTKLQVLGQAPGGEWLNVRNDEGIIGWVGVNFVQGGYDGPPPPVITPKDVLLVTGQVLDTNGNPASGIGFAVTQQTSTQTLRADAATDESGKFYAYLPPIYSGAWTVSFNSVACTSNTMDAGCNCLGGACGKPDPETATVTLPQSAPLSFIWK